jgi:hypothetical protein
MQLSNADEREVWAWGQAQRLIDAMASSKSPCGHHRELLTEWLIDAVERGLNAAQPTTTPSRPTAQESA